MKFYKNRIITTGIITGLTLALSACANQQQSQLDSDLSKTSSTKSDRYVAAVTSQARDRGVDVVWVNRPKDSKNH